MATPKGHRKEHGTDRAVYPKVRTRGVSVKIKKPSTRGTGMKKRT